ncbi:cytochrome c [bacterium]|nr:cytochrome c [bacterium]
MADKKQQTPPVEPFINWSRIPKNWIWVSVILANLSLVPLGVVYAHRNLHWRQPRTSIIPDMDNQYRWNPQQYDPEFKDGRVMRNWVEGTVPVGMLHEDDHLYRGIEGERFATTFPDEIQIDNNLIERGENRYQIYCAVCHGEAGYGDGMIEKRASQLAISGNHRGLSWVTPLSYHSDELRARPVGHIFNTISNGIRTMPGYKSQITVEDRWAIVAYIRTLQLSQWTPVTQVDQADRERLLKQIEANRSQAPAMDSEAGSEQAGSDAEMTEGTQPEGDAPAAEGAMDTANQAEADGGNG